MSEYSDLERAQEFAERQEQYRIREIESGEMPTIADHIRLNREGGIQSVNAVFPRVEGKDLIDVVKSLPEKSNVWDLGVRNGKLLMDTKSLNQGVNLMGIAPRISEDKKLDAAIEVLEYSVISPTKILEQKPERKPMLIISTKVMENALPHPANFLIETLEVLNPKGYAFINNLPQRFTYQGKTTDLVFRGKASLLRELDHHGVKSNLDQVHEFDGGFCYIPVLALQKGLEDKIDIPYDIYAKEMNDKNFLVVDFTVEH
jgi:hypothetical protein